MFESTQTVDKIRSLLSEHLTPSELQIEDQSHLHAGHKSAGGGGHFFVLIRSKKFNSLAPLARQRLILDLVKPLMDKEIHALSMKCIPE